MVRLAVDNGPAVLSGFFDGSDWQQSTNGLAAYDALDKLIGVAQTATSPQLSWAHGYNSDGTHKYQRLYTPRLDADRQRGRISVMTWISFNLSNKSDTSMNNEAILAGKHDAYIKQFAQDAAAWGHKFVVRFDPEMNGWWEGPFSEYDSKGVLANGNTDGSFARMWNYVVEMVRPIAPKILWAWVANPLSNSAGNPTYVGKLPHFLPKDTNVDFVGLDIYNKASDGPNSPWLTFRECLEGKAGGWPVNSLVPVLALAPGKPWLVGEWGCAPATVGDTTPGAGDRAKWVSDALNLIRTRYPFIRILQYFNLAPYAIDAAMAVGFTQGLNDPHYPSAPLPDPDSQLYGVVTVPDLDAALAAAQAKLIDLQNQLAQAQQADLSDVQALQAKLQAYQQAASEVTDGLAALSAIK